ncbi:MAG: ATP-binding protein [Myxococcota bacterium]|nr:ATP-binding protein [Myxococcota bacterium]
MKRPSRRRSGLSARQKQLRELERGQREILEAIAHGATESYVLERIVRLIEARAEGMLCSIVLFDEQTGTIHTGAAPNLPPAYLNAIEGLAIGPEAGSCGAAIFRREPVIVEDIATHPFWAPYRELALPFGLAACWSTPFFADQGQVLGSFAMYFRERRAPSASQARWVERATHLASIAVGRTRMEKAIRAERANIDAQARLLDLASDAITCTDLDGSINYWNGGAERLYGYTRSEALGRRVQDLIYAGTEQFEGCHQSLLEAGFFSGELGQLDKHGRPIVVDARWTLIRDAAGNPEGVLSINTDVTRRKQLEEDLQRSRRLESIGRFAGGIAHDFNNILLAISANTTLVAESKLEDAFAKEALAEVLDATARAKELVRQILTFSRQREPKRESIAPSRVVAEVLRLVRPALPPTIELESVIDENTPEILADATQLHQVAMNLVNNAAQAMPGGGRLSVRVERAKVSTPPPDAPRLGPGVYARLTVSDTGFGMDEATQQRIFEPFFTTKAVQGGTGLGLSVVDGIIKTHGGSVVVTSKPGKGSSFAVYLPAAR